MSVGKRIPPKPTDIYAAAIVDGVSNVRIEGLSMSSASGTALIVRNADGIDIAGKELRGATGGLEVANTKNSQFVVDKIIATGSGGQMSAADIRSLISEEIKAAQISHSQKTELMESVNSVFQNQQAGTAKEKVENFLANYANLSTSLGFTWNIMQNLARALS